MIPAPAAAATSTRSVALPKDEAAEREQLAEAEARRAEQRRRASLARFVR